MERAVSYSIPEGMQGTASPDAFYLSLDMKQAILKVEIVKRIAQMAIVNQLDYDRPTIHS